MEVCGQCRCLRALVCCSNVLLCAYAGCHPWYNGVASYVDNPSYKVPLPHNAEIDSPRSDLPVGKTSTIPGVQRRSFDV
jgi:hypothetical protein